MAASSNRKHTFVTIQDLYSKAGKLIKRDLELELTVCLDDVKAVVQTFTKKGGVYDDRCTIMHEFYGAAVVKGASDEVVKLIYGHVKEIGFNKQEKHA